MQVETIRYNGRRFAYEMRGDEIDGRVLVEATRIDEVGRLERDDWWVDLVRVGDPESRGKGHGTRAMKRAMSALRLLAAPRRVGLRPHALTRTPRDLTGWYRRLGFTEPGPDGSLWTQDGVPCDS